MPGNNEQTAALITAAAQRFQHQGHEPEELYQRGSIGLIKAQARFDPTAEDGRFLAFACVHILREMHSLCAMNTAAADPYMHRAWCVQLRKAQACLKRRKIQDVSIEGLSHILRIEPCELVMRMEIWLKPTIQANQKTARIGPPLDQSIRQFPERSPSFW